MSLPDELAQELSREFAVLVEPSGKVLSGDRRAERLLGLRAGAELRALASPGSEEKLTRLLEAAAVAPVFDVELRFQTAGQQHALRFNAAPTSGGIALVGTVLAAGAPSNLETRPDELRDLERDLGDSERGVRVLQQELEEKSDSLQQLREQKTRLLANVSHDLRTPLNSILGLTQLLLSRTDGALTGEQEKQIGFIRRSAEGLSAMVSELLDPAKLDADKVVFRPTRFQVADVFSALRGTLKSLPTREGVELIIDEPAPRLPALETDEGKLGQILRNLVSNALKFTERGSVRVSATATDYGALAFTVKDTGIGIAAADHQRIFEEFVQADHPIQRKLKGTGLGLALSRRLATLLGGEILLQSAPGEGSTFTVVVPAVHPDVVEMNHLRERSAALEPGRAPVLVVEDDRQTLLLYEQYLRGSGFQVVPARTVEEARAALRTARPSAVVLDLMLEGESSWRFLQELKDGPETRDIPVLVVTIMNREAKARALGADEFCVKPLDQAWLLRKLQALARTGPVERVLVIDDDEVSRYLIKKLLAGAPYSVLEAATGPEGIRMARYESPQVIFLDFVLAEMTAFEVLDELKRDPATRSIPIIVATAQSLNEEERSRLATETSAVLSKQGLSREVAIGRIRDALTKAVRP